MADQTWKTNLRAVYKTNNTRNGWVSYKPSSAFPAVTQLETGTFYLLDVATAFDLPGFDLPGFDLPGMGLTATSATAEILLVDEAPTENSVNLVSSGGIWSYIKNFLGTAKLTTTATTIKKAINELVTSVGKRVFMGTGIGQNTSNVVKIEWSDKGLKVTVDETDLGVVAFKSDIKDAPAGYSWSKEPDLTVTNGTGGGTVNLAASKVTYNGTTTDKAATSFPFNNAAAGKRRRDLYYLDTTLSPTVFKQKLGDEVEVTKAAPDPELPAGGLLVGFVNVADGGGGGGSGQLQSAYSRGRATGVRPHAELGPEDGLGGHRGHGGRDCHRGPAIPGR
ncbi:hypothetical protein [Rufibacter hautae]|uniref:hypothetical protein n=1 Tax=Rufibacter hautae TaxID=2595005 RepID=UPI001680AD8A|nr:hypothetical protein [Rufibacter hautae]